MGRPRIYTEPRIATAVRLPISLREDLQAAAAERDVSVNLLVTRAVRDYLQRLPSVADAPVGDPPVGDPPVGPRRAGVEATS